MSSIDPSTQQSPILRHTRTHAQLLDIFLSEHIHTDTIYTIQNECINVRKEHTCVCMADISFKLIVLNRGGRVYGILYIINHPIPMHIHSPTPPIHTHAIHHLSLIPTHTSCPLTYAAPWRCLWMRTKRWSKWTSCMRDWVCGCGSLCVLWDNSMALCREEFGVFFFIEIGIWWL